MNDAAEKKIGPYDVLRWLARGGMGNVFLAEKRFRSFRRKFAVKKLHPHLSEDRAIVAMFLDEASLAARFSHPLIVPVIDYGEDEGGPWIAMPFVPGVSLSRMQEAFAAHGAVMPLDAVGQIAVDVLSALHAAHELRDDDGRHLELVHRDASPHNVLVGDDGFARLIDFGIAHAAFGRSNSTAGDVVKGNPDYCSPEQVTAAPLDRRTDLFTFGIVLWELVAGRRLFAGGHPYERMERIARAPIPPPSAFRPIPLPLERVIMRALERDREHRCQTAAVFAAEIVHALYASGVVPASRAAVASLVFNLAERSSTAEVPGETSVIKR